MNGFSLKSDFVRKLDRDVTSFIEAGIDNADEERFNELALRGFELQYHTLDVYRAYCRRKNLTPKKITIWKEIPAVPSFPLAKLTRNAFSGKVEHHAMPNRDVVELKQKRRPVYPDPGSVRIMNTANDMLAKAYLFPDVERIRMLLLVPPPLMAPGMVMASGLQRMKRLFGTQDSQFIISFSGLKLKALINALKQSERDRQPMALIGATMALDYFFNACAREGIRFRLPEGSRVCDSGGYQGRYAKCTEEEFLVKCREILGIQPQFSVNALWLCENSTVYFDAVLRNAVNGASTTRRKDIPPWCRVVAVNPSDFSVCPAGEPGLLRHYDLANRAMAFCVQTDKIGIEIEDGFDVIGTWNKNVGSSGIEQELLHPGGRFITGLMDRMMQRKFSKTRETYDGLHKG